jgi:hypothetical protein
MAADRRVKTTSAASKIVNTESFSFSLSSNLSSFTLRVDAFAAVVDTLLNISGGAAADFFFLLLLSSSSAMEVSRSSQTMPPLTSGR